MYSVLLRLRLGSERTLTSSWYRYNVQYIDNLALICWMYCTSERLLLCEVRERRRVCRGLSPSPYNRQTESIGMAGRAGQQNEDHVLGGVLGSAPELVTVAALA